MYKFFFFNDTATTEIYTLSLHDALPIYDFKLALTFERELTREHLVEHHTQRVNVAPRIERRALHLLWRYVAKRADDRTHGRKLRIADGFRKAESAQPHDPFRGNHQAGSREAPVDNPASMRALKRRKGITGVLHGVFRCDRTRLQPLRHRDAGNVLGGHHQLAFNLPRVVKRHNVRMDQPGMYFDFPEKPRRLLLIVLPALGQNLQNFEALRENVSNFIGDTQLGAS